MIFVCESLIAEKMKRTLFLFAGMLPLLFLTGCSRKTSAVTKPTMEAHLPDPVKTDPSFRPPAVFDFTIDSARISEKAGLLYVYINYSGGCNDHRFEAVTTGAWAESIPPQITVFIKHDNGGDACREQLSKTLVYDIKGLRYQAAGKEEIQLNIGSFKLKYTPQ